MAALWLVIAAAFPYFYGEVGASRYAREHRGEAIAEVLGAIVLLGIAVSEYHFVPPDCLAFRGLKVVHRPKYVMCGYRSPAGSYDTSTADTTLLAKARAQPPFRDDWESVVQQQGFPPTSNLP